MVVDTPPIDPQLTFLDPGFQVKTRGRRVLTKLWCGRRARLLALMLGAACLVVISSARGAPMTVHISAIIPAQAGPAAPISPARQQFHPPPPTGHKARTTAPVTSGKGQPIPSAARQDGPRYPVTEFNLRYEYPRKQLPALTRLMHLPIVLGATALNLTPPPYRRPSITAINMAAAW